MRTTVRRVQILPTREAVALMRLEDAALTGVCEFKATAYSLRGQVVDGYQLSGFGSAALIFFPSMKGATFSKVLVQAQTKNEALVLARKAKEVGLLKFDSFTAVLSAINDAVETGAKNGIKINFDVRLIQSLDKIREQSGESRNAIITRFVKQGVERTFKHED